MFGIWPRIIAGLAALGGILAAGFAVRRSGANANEMGHMKQDAAARARVDAAVAGAPRDKDELVGKLRNGGRL